MKKKIPIAEYHADPALGSTGVNLLLDRPSKFKARVIDGIIEQKQCFTIGSALHKLLLEPDTFADEFIISDVDKRTKEFKELARTNAGRTFLKPAEAAQVQAMRDGVLRNRVAAALLGSQHETEVSVFWTEPVTGVPCKCRPDGLVADFHGRHVVFDVKTAADASPREFARAAAIYGLHRQAAHYIAGIETESMHPVDDWYLVAVEKEPPFDCGTYLLDPAAIELGRTDCHRAYDLFKKCRQTGNYPGLAELTTLGLPEWYTRGE